MVCVVLLEQRAQEEVKQSPDYFFSKPAGALVTILK